MAINRDKVYDGAMKLLSTGKFDKGIIEFQKLVAEDPKDVRTHLKIAETLHVKMGKRKEALEAYDRAASVYSEQGFFLKAVAVYKQMLSVDATSPDLHLRLAELYQQLGYGAQCLHHYQQVVVLYEQQGRSKDMLAVLKRMVDLDPENLQSRVKVAELFYMQGMVQEAVVEMRQAFDFLHGQSRFDDALRVGEKVCAWDPGAVDVARQLGAIYMQRGEAKSALSKLQVCYAHAPRDVEVLGLIASAFLAIDQVGKTVSVYKEMARIHEDDGNVDGARRCWEFVLQYAPADDDANTGLGRRPAAATPVATTPLAAPASPMNLEDERLKRLLTETDVYVKYGLRPKAVEHLEKIFEIRPDYLPGLEKLRQLQKQMKQMGPAQETLRRLVARGREANHPKAGEWAAELAQLEAAPAPKPPASRPPPPPLPPPASMSAEGDIFLDDEGPVAASPTAMPVRPRLPPAPVAHEPLDEPLDEPAPLRPIIRGAPPPRTASLDESLEAPLDEPLNEAPGAGPAAAPGPSAAAPPALPDDVDEPDADAIARAALGLAEDMAPAPGGGDSWAAPQPGDDGQPADELVFEQEAAPGPEPAARSAPAPVLDDEVGMLDALASQAVQEAIPSGGFDADGGFDDAGFGRDVAPPPPLVEDEFGERTVAYGSEDWHARVRAAQNQPTADDSLMETGERRRVASFDPPVDDDTSLIVPPQQTLSGAPGPDDEAAAEPFDPNAFDFPDDVKALLPPPPPVADAVEEPVATAAPTAADALDDDDDDFETVGTGNYDAAELQSLASAEAEAIDEVDGELQALAEGVSSAAAISDAFSEAFGPGGVDAAAADDDNDDNDIADAFNAIKTGDDGPFEAAPPQWTAPAATVDDVPDAPSMSRALFAPERGFEDDPANTFFPDELAEAEFFIQQELLDEAREILEPILEEVGDSERVKHMLARVAAKEAGEPEPPPPWQQKIFDDVAAEAAPSPELSDPGRISVEDVLSQFKRGIAETVPEDDAATHYDLGIAYREMGLLDDAVSEFEVAARAVSKAPDAWFLVGVVRLDQGRTNDALDAFDKAVAAPLASRAQRAAAEYQRGVVFVDHYDNGIEALVALKRSKLLGGTAPDLERRIDALVKMHGDIDVAGSAGSNSVDAHPKNVDHV